MRQLPMGDAINAVLSLIQNGTDRWTSEDGTGAESQDPLDWREILTWTRCPDLYQSKVLHGRYYEIGNWLVIKQLVLLNVIVSHVKIRGWYFAGYAGVLQYELLSVFPT